MAIHKSMKSAKVFTLEIIRLYGNLYIAPGKTLTCFLIQSILTIQVQKQDCLQVLWHVLEGIL